MRFTRFLRSTPGRVTRIAMGCFLVWIGAVEASLTGLLIMMVGVVPVVTALAGVSLIDDIVSAVVAAKQIRMAFWMPHSRLTRR